MTNVHALTTLLAGFLSMAACTFPGAAANPPLGVTFANVCASVPVTAHAVYVVWEPDRGWETASLDALGDLDPTERKAAFIAAVTPIVMAVDAAILRDRARLVAVREHLAQGCALDAGSAIWLDDLAGHYGGNAQNIETLLAKVDVIPPSLAVAQAAIESGWGTSRFAAEGNALFGERVWSERIANMMAREAAVRVRAFSSLYESVERYTLNLNTNPAYAGFRDVRAGLREREGAVTGIPLAATLTKYSERRSYVNDIVATIRANGLQPLDHVLAAFGPNSPTHT